MTSLDEFILDSKSHNRIGFFHDGVSPQMYKIHQKTSASSFSIMIIKKKVIEEDLQETNGAYIRDIRQIWAHII